LLKHATSKNKTVFSEENSKKLTLKVWNTLQYQGDWNFNISYQEELDFYRKKIKLFLSITRLN
jgi:hypothetical protein